MLGINIQHHEEGQRCAVLSHSVVSDSFDPRDCSHQAPPFMGFSRQEYWSGLPFPSPKIFPIQGSNLYILCLLHCRQILGCTPNLHASRVPWFGEGFGGAP